MSKKRGRETKFLTELKHSFNWDGHYAYKIPDTPPSMGMRFTTEKPFDMVVSVNGSNNNGATKPGTFVAIEAKMLYKWEEIGRASCRERV